LLPSRPATVQTADGIFRTDESALHLAQPRCLQGRQYTAHLRIELSVVHGRPSDSVPLRELLLPHMRTELHLVCEFALSFLKEQ